MDQSTHVISNLDGLFIFFSRICTQFFLLYARQQISLFSVGWFVLMDVDGFALSTEYLWVYCLSHTMGESHPGLRVHMGMCLQSSVFTWMCDFV